MADFTGGPGLLAFIATFALVGAAILLFRSLGKHLRKVRTHPPTEAPAQDSAGQREGEVAPDADASEPTNPPAADEDGTSKDS